MAKPILTGRSARLSRLQDGTISSGQLVVSSPSGDYPSIHDWTGLPQTSDGWTDLLAMVQASGAYETAPIYYVSSSGGSDTTYEVYTKYHTSLGGNGSTVAGDPWNPTGTIRPFASYSKVKTLINALAAPRTAIVLFKRGDTFNETLTTVNSDRPFSGASASERIIFSAYGTGARPRIANKTDNTLTFSWSGVAPNIKAGWEGRMIFSDLHFINPAKDWGSVDYEENIANNGGKVSVSGGFEDVLFENCLFQHAGNEIQAQRSERQRRMAWRRCVFRDVYKFASASVYQDGHVQGAFFNDIDGLLIDECVAYANGWNRNDPDNTQNVNTHWLFNHNFYIQDWCTSVVFRRNVSAWACSYGLHGRSGGDIYENILMRNPHIQIGYGATSNPHGPLVAHVYDNLVLDGDNQWPTNTSYTEQNGYGMIIHTLTDSLIERNIIAHNTHGKIGIGISLSWWNASKYQGTDNVTVKDNIVWKWDAIRTTGFGAAFSASGSYDFSNMVIDGNTFYSTDSNQYLVSIPSTVVTSGVGQEVWMQNNRYGGVGNAGFQLNGAVRTYATYQSMTGDAAGLTYGGFSYPAPDRKLIDWLAIEFGYTAADDDDAFDYYMEYLIAVDRSTYDRDRQYRGLLNYIRAGFGMSEV